MYVAQKLHSTMLAKEKKYKPWSQEEQERFAHFYRIYKRDFESYQEHFADRTLLQIESFFYNVQKRKQRNAERATSEQLKNMHLIVFDEWNDSVYQLFENPTHRIYNLSQLISVLWREYKFRYTKKFVAKVDLLEAHLTMNFMCIPNFIVKYIEIYVVSNLLIPWYPLLCDIEGLIE